jgi:hypothetical protein
MRILVLVCLLFSWAYAEEMEDVIKRTDMSNADAVYELSQWCAKNNKPTKARQYLNKVIEIDKDHEAARAALGQVRVGDRWVSAQTINNVKPGAKPPAGDPGPGRVAEGPGPAANQIPWDLTLPPGANVDNEFISKYINQLNSSKNDSEDMDAAVNTLVREDNLKYSIPLLCAALLRPDFTDLYGTSEIIRKLIVAKKWPQAKCLVPFLAKTSERCNDPEDLYTFAYVAPLVRDRRLIPRMIELMDHPNQEVKDAATTAAAALTLLPKKDVTTARIKQWWDLNHNVSDQQVFSEQLNNPDPLLALAAARGLYDFRDKNIMPVAIRLLKHADKQVNNEAIDLIRSVTGNDWGYDTSLPPEKKAKLADEITAWWKEEQHRFVWVEDRNSAVGTPQAELLKRDPVTEWVQQMASTEGNLAQQAESNLKGKGKEAVPGLILGLSDRGVIVRRKCDEVLKAISKQDFGFNPRSEPAEAAKAIEAWKKWANSQGIKLIEVVEEAVPEEGGGIKGKDNAPKPQEKKPEKENPEEKKPAKGNEED